MTSPRLLIFADRARTQGSAVRHMPESSPPFLLGPDEVCFNFKPSRRPWKFRALCVAAIFLGIGLALWPHIMLYFQALIGK